MCLIFGNDDGGDGLLMRAPLETLFWDFGIGEFRKCELTCSEYEEDCIMEFPFCVGLTFLEEPFVLTGFDYGFKFVVRQSSSITLRCEISLCHQLS